MTENTTIKHSSQEIERACDVCVHDFRTQGNQSKTRIPYNIKKPVFFIGFMGAGKTTIARKIARYAHVTAIDADCYLERCVSMRIGNIFNEHGEETFRQIESEILRELANKEPALISCGGGVIVREENRKILRDCGYVVYLEATARGAAARIQNYETRPLFKDLDNAERVLEERRSFYEEVADMTVNTDGRDTTDVAHELFALLQEKGIMWLPES